MAKFESFDELDGGDKRSDKPRRRRRPSLFGFLSAVVGVAAGLVAFRDRLPDFPYKGYLFRVDRWDYTVNPYHVAAAGAVLALLALLGRTVVGFRTRVGWPVLGLLVCGLAAGAVRYQNSPRDPGSPERWVEVNVVDRVAKVVGRVVPGAASAGPTTQPTPPAAVDQPGTTAAATP